MWVHVGGSGVSEPDAADRYLLRATKIAPIYVWIYICGIILCAYTIETATEGNEFAPNAGAN